jgi:hypothetical protein
MPSTPHDVITPEAVGRMSDNGCMKNQGLLAPSLRQLNQRSTRRLFQAIVLGTCATVFTNSTASAWGVRLPVIHEPLPKIYEPPRPPIVDPPLTPPTKLPPSPPESTGSTQTTPLGTGDLDWNLPVLEDPALRLSLRHWLTQSRLQAAYRPAALKEIQDPLVRTRVAPVLLQQSIVNRAAFAGRERQFAAAVQQTTIIWPPKYPPLSFKVKPTPYIVGTVHPEDIFNFVPRYDTLTDLRAKINIRDEIEHYLSAASEKVTIEDFATQAQYERALKQQLVQILSAEKTTEKPRFTFDVVTGKLEMPALITTGLFEIKAGEVDIYQLVATAAQAVFGGSSVSAATQQSTTSSQTAAPAPAFVQNEEKERRELVRSLSAGDLPYVKSIAPDLFAQS